MEFQLSCFKSWKMMLWKCCTQCASKCGKLSSGHRTGKGQFSFQSQRKAMPKNVQPATQLYSSHTQAKYCSKFSKPGFSSTWTMNFQMFKLVLGKAEEPKIKLPTSIGSSRRRQWHPTPALLPGKSHGWRSLVGCSPWGRRVGQDCMTSLSLFTFMLWRMKWQPTPVFLPGESQGRGSLVGCRLWGRTESDTTEAT